MTVFGMKDDPGNGITHPVRFLKNVSYIQQYHNTNKLIGIDIRNAINHIKDLIENIPTDWRVIDV